MTQIQLRRATAASWTSVNPILALGEVGIETDTYKLKVGNGTSQWSSLAYFVHSWADITGKPSDLVTLTGTQTLTGKTLTSPRANAILDTNGATNISIGAVTSAVNYFQVNNAATGNGINLYALGSDTNIDLNLLPKGSGSLLANSVPLVTTTATQSLSNKTLTNPTVNAYTEGVVTVGTVSTSHTLAITAGTVITATLTASTACTFTMPTAAAGKSFVLLLKQAASTGNGTATFTGVKWGGGTAPTITATAGRMDILSFVSDGTNWYGTAAQNFTP